MRTTLFNSALFALLIVAAVAALIGAGPSKAQNPFVSACDMDQNGMIDKLDIALITRKNGTVVPPGSLGDGNGDGRITLADASYCTSKCTLPRCAVAP